MELGKVQSFLWQWTGKERMHFAASHHIALEFVVYAQHFHPGTVNQQKQAMGKYDVEIPLMKHFVEVTL
jgi:hypothetical protein